MNRSVLARQMFAKGGAAFPDLNKDGEITQADILMGRGVEFKQEGGIAGMMPEQPPAIAAGMAAGQAAMMPDPGAPAQQAAGAIDPTVIQQMLSGAAEAGIGDLENMEDPEDLMNAIRGDDASVEERYAELAQVVGPEDAQQTPESVLALVQPVMMMASVDQGIGELAQEEMSAPVEGAMAQGIMSTVAPPEPMPMEGAPPVNFKDGGLVRRGDNQPVQMYQPGGEVTDPIAGAGRLGELYQQKMPLYTSVVGDPTADLEEQKKLTQSQMLFDIANTALAFAAPMEGERPGMSAAERLAFAARTTKLPQTIGARAQAQRDKEAAAKAQQQQLKLSALSAAEAGLAAETKAAAELEQTKVKGAQKIAELKLSDKLSSASARALENLKQKGAASLEDRKQANRVALEGVQQQNREAIEKLEQSGVKANTILADKLKKENMEIQANIELGKMDVANEYELAKMEEAHKQATELNTTNNALREKLANMDNELAQRRLKLDTIKAEVARAQGERKIDLQEEALKMEAEMNTFEQGYKNKKLALEEAAARLTRLGTSTEARITTLLSNPESLAKYAAGMMDADDTLEFNQAIAYYNAPKQVWNEKEKRFVLSPGNPLSNELLSSIRIRRENGLSVPNIKLDEAAPENKPLERQPDFTNAVTVGLQNPMSAFGSVAVGKNVINNLFEFFTASAPFKPEKSAINAAKTLNQNFLQTFQKSAELRESVFQAQLLQDLTPKPLELFTGPDTSADKVDKILGMITNAKQVLQNKIDNLPLDSKEYKDAQTFLLQMNQLEDGYGVFRNAYRLGSASQGKVDTLRGIIQKGKKN